MASSLRPMWTRRGAWSKVAVRFQAAPPLPSSPSGSDRLMNTPWLSGRGRRPARGAEFGAKRFDVRQLLVTVGCAETGGLVIECFDDVQRLLPGVAGQFG